MRFGRVLAPILSLVCFAVLTGTPAHSAEGPFQLPVTEGPRPWIIPAETVRADDVHFAVLGNFSWEEGQKGFSDLISHVAGLHPDFIITTGTLVGDLRPGETVASRWDQIENAIGKIGTPFFFCPGAAELSGTDAGQQWAKRFGPTYYYFVRGGALFCVLNTEESAQGRLSPEQMVYFQRAISSISNPRWTYVFMHRPLWTRAGDSGWAAFEQMLGDRDYTAFAGASGRYTLSHRKARELVTVPATSAAGELRGAEFGEIEGFAWATLSGSKSFVSAIDSAAIHGAPRIDEGVLALIRALDANPVSISPLRTMERVFTSQKLIVRAENTTDVPMQVAVHLDLHKAIRFLPDKATREVPPKSVENMLFDCRALRPLQPGNPEPVVVRGSVSYMAPGLQPVSSDFLRKVSIEAPIDVPPRKGPFQMDGRLLEWRLFPVVCKEPVQIDGPVGSWTGPEDCSFQFATAYDDTNFYLALEIQDDSVVASPNKSPGEQDAVQVLLSPFAPSHGAQIKREDLLSFTLSPGELGRDPIRLAGENWPAGVKAAFVKTLKGANLELAIPLSIFTSSQGGNWTGFQMNIAVDDYDAGKTTHKRIWWRPGWNGETIDGESGVFLRR